MEGCFLEKINRTDKLSKLLSSHVETGDVFLELLESVGKIFICEIIMNKHKKDVLN